MKKDEQTTGEKTGLATAIRPALTLFVILWLMTGIIYPLIVYAFGQLIFPAQAQGSLILDSSGHVTGSKLIGQPFSAEKYFWPRPSATSDFPYNPLASSGSNLGPTSRSLKESVSNRTADMMAANNAANVPSDLVMASASGLDPHISVNSARVQVKRVAKARKMDEAAVNRLIDEHTEKPYFGFLGQARVNVLLLNQALDGGQSS